MEAFIILLIQLQRIKCGISNFQGPVPSVQDPFYSVQFSLFVENFRRRLINQAETVGLPYLETKRPIFSTKKNFTLSYQKKKSSTGSLALCVRRQWSLFHLRAAFNEINPLLTVT